MISEETTPQISDDFEEFSDEEDLDEETNEQVELEECLLDVKHFVSCLYMFSITLRNPAPRDKIEKWSAIDVSSYVPFDVQHLSDKFPLASDYLHQRLGKANSRRRQLLLYNEQHNAKISKKFPLQRGFQPQIITNMEPINSPRDVDYNLDIFKEENLENLVTGDDSQVTDLDNQYREDVSVAQTQTTVSTITMGNLSHLPLDRIEENFDDAVSITSFASSVSENGTKLRVPLPPEDAADFEGDPFICPYCFSQETVKSDRMWK